MHWQHCTDGCCRAGPGMTHGDTRHRFDGKEPMRFLAAQFNTLIQILPLPRRADQNRDIQLYVPVLTPGRGRVRVSPRLVFECAGPG